VESIGSETPERSGADRKSLFMLLAPHGWRLRRRKSLKGGIFVRPSEDNYGLFKIQEILN